MSLVALIAWRPLLAVAVVTLIAVGPSPPNDHASAPVEMSVDRPEGPRPHRRCRGPPTTETSRTDPTATPQPTAQGTPHPPDPSHPPTTPVPDHHRSRRPVQAPPFANTDVLEPPIHNRTTSATTPAVRDQPERLSGIGRIRCPGSLDYAVARYHYLGYVPLAGAQLRYLIEADCGLLGALSFGASAWKCASRDTHIGWDAATRESRLHLVVGNARFLILPDAAVPNLASAVLARATRRLPGDWQESYGYAPVLVETFVETARFAGTSYRPANWIRVGQTKGRGKLDRTHAKALPVKDVYVYPLHRAYKTILTAPPTP